MSSKLSPEIITAAIEGFEAQKRRIDEQIGELRAMLNGGQPKADGAPQKGKRRTISAAGSGSPKRSGRDGLRLRKRLSLPLRNRRSASDG
jgi:hypothetical protein